MSKVRDIIGMCHLIDGLDYLTNKMNDNLGCVKEHNRTIFDGTVNDCHAYVSLYKRMAKHKQVAELLETICRGNIEILLKDSSSQTLDVMTFIQEIEEVYLSDEEVNEREKRK